MNQIVNLPQKYPDGEFIPRNKEIEKVKLYQIQKNTKMNQSNLISRIEINFF
jgi:hypothetical protein